MFASFRPRSHHASSHEHRKHCHAKRTTVRPINLVVPVSRSAIFTIPVIPVIFRWWDTPDAAIGRCNPWGMLIMIKKER